MDRVDIFSAKPRPCLDEAVININRSQADSLASQLAGNIEITPRLVRQSDDRHDAHQSDRRRQGRANPIVHNRPPHPGNEERGSSWIEIEMHGIGRLLCRENIGWYPIENSMGLGRAAPRLPMDLTESRKFAAESGFVQQVSFAWTIVAILSPPMLAHAVGCRAGSCPCCGS